MKGIDLSFHDGFPDWGKTGEYVDFAILAVTKKRGKDESFEHNYEGAKEHNVRVGAYKLTYAQNVTQAKQEVKEILEILNQRPLDLPFFLDLEEEGGQLNIPQDKIYRIIRVYEKAIKGKGYKFGIYCNRDWYGNIIPERVKNRRFWIASYPKEDNGEPVEKVKPTEVNKLFCWQYSECGKVPGIDSPVDMDIWIGNTKQPVSNTPTAEDIISLASSYIGTHEGDYAHKRFVDTYNAHTPLAQGYKVTYTDSWCALFVSFLFIVKDAVSLIGGTECGVERFVSIFKGARIWEDANTAAIKRGDLIVFDWENNDFSDHIGIVESVENGMVHTIEGNSGNEVRRRTYSLGDHNIKGYAHPKYGTYTYQVGKNSSLDAVAQEVINGAWGNGEDRKNRLENAGYNYDAVQKKVNEVLNGNHR